MRGCWMSVLVTALASGAAASVLVLFLDEYPEMTLAFIFGFLISLVVVGLAAAVLGFPLTQLLSNSGWERPWSYPLAGLVFGGAIAYLFVEASQPYRPVSITLLRDLLPGALPGAVRRIVVVVRAAPSPAQSRINR